MVQRTTPVHPHAPGSQEASPSALEPSASQSFSPGKHSAHHLAQALQ